MCALRAIGGLAKAAIIIFVLFALWPYLINVAWLALLVFAFVLAIKWIGMAAVGLIRLWVMAAQGRKNSMVDKV